MNKELASHIATILEVSIEEIESSESFAHFQKFDSFAQIQIAVILETEFDCIIDPEQFELLNSMESIIELINSN